MKELLTVLAFLLSGALGQAPAPYPPSGWRPNGPAFELPSTQKPIKQDTLPPQLPLDPRNPAVGPTAFPEEDVSVQGLPTQEQQPIFQVSPINGQQYVGPSFNSDIQNLDQRYRQSQFQAQQERLRELARQRQLEVQAFESRRQSTQQTPHQFAQKTTPEPRDLDTTTEPISLNEGETLEDVNRPAVPAKQKNQVSVEVTKQQIQEYPPEVFLSPLAQLRYQPQVISLDQLSQLKAPVFLQQVQSDASQKQVQGYDGPAHLSALTSILAQRQLTQPQEQNQQFAQVFFVPQQQSSNIAAAPVAQYQPQVAVNQYQPAVEVQQTYPQYQAQPVVFQPQTVNQQPTINQQAQHLDQSQLVYQQYQPQVYQVQADSQAQPNQFSQSNQVENFDQNQQTYRQPQLFQVQPQAQQPVQSNQVENFDQNQQTYRQPQLFQVQPQVQQPVQSNQVENFDQSQLAYQQPQLYPLQQQNLGQPQNQDFALYYQQQILGQQVQSPQDSLQSGLDINQQGNNIDEDKTNGQNDGATATAVATAFGTRTQPRVANRYGAPPRPFINSGAETTTELRDREETTEGPAVAQASAVADGDRRKSAKLRARRVRPVFTLDRSGHLVLAQE